MEKKQLKKLALIEKRGQTIKFSNLTLAWEWQTICLEYLLMVTISAELNHNSIG